LKFINGTLKADFSLDNTSKSKPVAGPDDLLVLLVQHWARDESIYPTEDDRLDVATIMLFQAYTGGRPAEFVHASKGKASEDPLGEAEEAGKNETTWGRVDSGHDRALVASDGPEYDDDSDDGDGPESDDDDNATDTHNKSGEPDSGYGTDEADVAMSEDTNDCYTTEIDDASEPVQQNDEAAELDEFGEVIRKYKALCYEDICLWIVQNPKEGERDLLAMEVHLRHHKGVDNKPKPYVACTCVLAMLTHPLGRPFYFERTLSPSFVRSPTS
jgi:hypothetical protein